MSACGTSWCITHYKPQWLGGVKSEADGPGFFFHPRGQVDPQGELEATLEAFFVGAAAEGQQAQGWQHPQCRFPARYDWLKAQSRFDPSKLPAQPCPRLEAWRAALDPGSVSLIFASYSLRNPASMFGHTFLRLNHKRRQGSQNLLDCGINYAAITTTHNGVLFAILGIAGGFEGRLANFPYDMKVQEYSNLESRHLWEYDLHFTQEQIDRMFRHLWELGSTFFWYYFFQWLKAEAGAGMAVCFGRSESDLAYAFFNVEAGLSEAFAADVRLSPGAMVGVTLRPLRPWKVEMGAALYAPIVGGGTTYYRNYLHQHLALTRNLGVRVELNQFKTTIEGLTAIYIYF